MRAARLGTSQIPLTSLRATSYQACDISKFQAKILTTFTTFGMLLKNKKNVRERALHCMIKFPSLHLIKNQLNTTKITVATGVHNLIDYLVD